MQDTYYPCLEQHNHYRADECQPAACRPASEGALFSACHLRRQLARGVRPEEVTESSIVRKIRCPKCWQWREPVEFEKVVSGGTRLLKHCGRCRVGFQEQRRDRAEQSRLRKALEYAEVGT